MCLLDNCKTDKAIQAKKYHQSYHVVGKLFALAPGR